MSSRLRSAVRLTAVAVATVSVSASAQTYAFPGSSADLPEGSHWWISSDHSGTENRDLSAVRFDATERRFTRVKIPFADYAVNPKNSDWVIYGLPVTAIADGEVLTCWRNAPEGLKPAVHGGDDVPHPESALSQDEMLDNISLYWLTDTAASSARIYWENAGSNFSGGKLDLPVGVSVFPRELFRAPKRWAEQTYSKLIYWNEPDRGGHFAAFEQPALFAHELRECFRQLRAK
nr:epoxid hydrolase homologue [Stigmatella aurantiaca]